MGELVHLPHDDRLNGLTAIPPTIHCPATQTSGRRVEDELDQLAIEHFLDTLAEVTLAIIRRRAASSIKREPKEEDV
jgi:hypothetical protein